MTTNPERLCDFGLVPGAVWYAHLQHAYVGGTLLGQICRDPNSPPEVLESIFVEEHAAGRFSGITTSTLAGNPTTPLGVIDAMIADGRLRALLRTPIAGRANLTEAQAEALLRPYSHEVLERLVRNPACPLKVLNNLGSRSELAHHVAGNPSTPVSALNWLRDNVLCAEALARNPHTPADILDAFIVSGQYTSVLVANSAMTPNWLRQANRDLHQTQAAVVLANPSCPDDLRKHYIEEYCYAREDDRIENGNRLLGLLRNPSCSSEMLEQIYRDGPGGDILVGLAAHPNTPEHLLFALAGTRRTPHGVHRTRDQDMAMTVAGTVLRRADCPLELKLAQHPAHLAHCEAASWNLPALEADCAQRLVALARSWTGTLDELIDSARMLAPAV